MRLAISNIAWEPEEDEAISQLLRKHDLDAIDVVPSKYFTTTAATPDAEVARVRQWWAGRGFEITGMQALMFGTSGLNLFGSKDAQQAMLCHLERICRIGAVLGCTRLVFGSPKSRNRGAATDTEADAIATSFFGRLGEIARALGVVICLEPNPPRYGANFLTTSAETASFVRRLGSPSIRMQLDTGALTVSGEAPGYLLAGHSELIGHVHASEPDLMTLGDGGCDHEAMAMAIRKHLGKPLVAIEMLASKTEGHSAAIERAIALASQHYRSPVGPDPSA